jgi:hypothetical protein
LVGAAGLPEWFAWRTEKARPLPSDSAPGGTFVLESRELGLLELLPDVPSDRYLFEAEVRLDPGNDGSAGLYFAADERAAPDRLEERFTVFRIADFGPFAGVVRLEWWRYVERDGSRRRPISSWGVPAKPPPLGPAGSWHSLKLTVAPEGVTASCDDSALPTVSPDEQKRRTTGWWEGQEWGPNPPPPPPPFAPSGGLGLFVRNGRVFFRNVSVTPLPKQG